MEEKRNKSSLFSGIPGIAVLFSLAAAASYFQAWQAAAFFFLLLFLCGSSFLWSRRVLKQIEVSVKALSGEGYAGDRLSLEINVKNNSFFPLTWLDVLLPTGTRELVCQTLAENVRRYQLEGWREAQTGIRLRFAWLLWQQEIRWTEELTALRRGVAVLEGASLQAGDGLGLSARERWYAFSVPAGLTVYPGIVPVRPQPFLKVFQEAAARNRGQTEDMTILKSSRPYMPGDPVKRINWRLLAGSGQMEVNVYETVMPGCMTFLLDLSSFRRTAERKEEQGLACLDLFLLERDLERMISLVASCMRTVAGYQIPATLIIPAYGDREAVLCIPDGEEPEMLLKQAMEALAKVDYRAEEPHFPYEEFWQAGHKLGNVHICTRTDEASGLDGLAEGLGRSRARYLVLERQARAAGEFECLYEEDICLERLDWENMEKEVLVGRCMRDGGSNETDH